VTLYARGYRTHEQGLDGKGPRWLPILSEGYRDAVKGKAFRRFTLLFTIILVFHCLWLYFSPEQILRAFTGRASDGGADSLLTATVTFFFVRSISFLVPLLAVFVASGLIAEDLRTRALPLYLVRAITPLDYLIGKMLIPVATLAWSVLGPLLFLVLFDALLQPSDEMLPFLGRQLPLLGAILGTWALMALSYSSVALLVSTLTGRRIPALILGAAVFVGGGIISGISHAMPDGGPSGLRALALTADVRVVFEHMLGDRAVEFARDQTRALPSPLWAYAMLLLPIGLASFVVLRRASTVEVTS